MPVADAIRTVIERVLRTSAMVASAVVLVGFGLWATDEMSEASSAQQRALGGQPSIYGTDGEQLRERTHGVWRERIDDANDVLLAPFEGIVPGDAGEWAQRGVPVLLALLLYGVGLGFTARYARGWA